VRDVQRDAREGLAGAPVAPPLSSLAAAERAEGEVDEGVCAHCGLEVPGARAGGGGGVGGTGRAGRGERAFCCHGCETAYGLINACGLGGYYALRRAAGELGAGRPVAEGEDGGGAYAEFDDESFVRLYARDVGSGAGGVGGVGLKSVDFVLEGMHCAACVWLMERLPSVVPGVVEARVQFRRGMVTVVYEAGRVRLSAVARALKALGYPPHAARERAARDVRVIEDRKHLVRIAVAGAMMGNIMILAFALYGGVLGGIEPLYDGLFRWLSMVLGVASLAGPGRVFFQSAWASVRARTPNLDVPIVLALVAGGVAGVVNTVLGRGEIYFDTLSALVFLLLVGRFVQHRQQRWAVDSVELLHALTPAWAWKVLPGEAGAGGGSVARTPIEGVMPGDVVEVRAGESIPVDGVVEWGASHADESILTGESRPVGIEPGSAVLAGAVNLSAPIRVRARATGAQTRAGRIMGLVEEASLRRAPILRFIDRVGVCFIVGVTLLAAVTLGAWWSVDRSAAIDHAVAMLIVTCPCALALAAPLAVGVTIGRASRRGMLIKGGDVFERLSRPGVVVLDKTGTITEGRLAVRWWMGDRASQRLAAAVESAVSHPIARAIAEFAPGPAALARGVRQTLGAGVQGVVNGHEVAVGSEAFIRGLGAEVDSNLLADVQRVRAAGMVGVLVAVDGRATAVAGLGDALRAGAAEAVATLKSLGHEVRLLSGDHPETVRAVGRELGLPAEACMGGVSPEGKAAYVRELVSAWGSGGRRGGGGGGGGTVVMVGDGVNDAAALASAGVGVAVQGGAEASLAAADVYLARPGLGAVVELVRSGPRVMRAIYAILAVSLVYNVISAGLTLLGLIHPMIAAAVMPISSLSVLAVAVRFPTLPGRAGVGGVVGVVGVVGMMGEREADACR
jgi:Cu2+-exporting ATPase